jgi:hypothetical protein
LVASGNMWQLPGSSQQQECSDKGSPHSKIFQFKLWEVIKWISFISVVSVRVRYNILLLPTLSRNYIH